VNKMKYDIESLKLLNQSYDYDHRVTQLDVDKVNEWVKIIENSRSKVPQVGDIVEFTNEHGNCYRNAHIEKTENNKLNICEQPYIPFISLSDSGKIYTSTSGGAWSNIPSDLKLIEQKEKYFNVWGHMGACGNGAVNFEAMVNVWEYKEECLYKGFSTKTHSKFYVDKLTEPRGCGYYFIVTKGAMSHTAFRTEQEYQAWLKTFNGVEFKGYWPNQYVVFTDKQIEKCIPKEEYLAIQDAIIDSTMCNGTIQECKRFYKDGVITTYLPYQNDKITLEHIKVEYINAYKEGVS
jgi:hypothetical protein